MSQRITLLDIEVSANLAHVWQLFDVTVNLEMLESPGEILCFASKTLGERNVTFSSVWKDGKVGMLKKLHKILSESDVVIGFNSTNFDIKWVNGQLLLCGFTPPPPFKQVDLYRVVKQNFKFPSNKLAYVSKALGIGGKAKHAGFDTWKGCLAGDRKSQALMERYNVQDTRLTEKLYNKLLPWIKNHPNRNLHGDTNGCINCGADKLQRRGSSRTATGVFDRYQCQACGKWQRGEKKRAASNLMREVP